LGADACVPQPPPPTPTPMLKRPRIWLFIDKKEANDKEVDGIIFCSGSSNNNINNSCSNDFSNLDWRDDDEFSPTFNVPDMDISAGPLH